MPIKVETRSRALALQLLYAWDVGPAAESLPVAWSRVLQRLPADARASDRALELAEAVVAGQRELDAHIERAAERWRIERLGVVDRNVLRLAVRELVERRTPPRVVIDEAVRLARWFGGVRSPAFVNGVLDRVARDLGRL